MSDEVIVYGMCDANCKHRVLTLDQTANLIQEMAANGFQVPEGFIPTTAVNSIVEQNKGKQLKLFLGTQSEYDAWTGDKETTHAIISDDPTLKNIILKTEELSSSLNGVINGRIPVGKATNSIVKANNEYVGFTLDQNGVLRVGDIIIPQKKVIFDEVKSTNGGTMNCYFTETLNAGDVIEIHYRWGNSTIQFANNFVKVKVGSDAKKSVPLVSNGSYSEEHIAIEVVGFDYKTYLDHLYVTSTKGVNMEFSDTSSNEFKQLDGYANLSGNSITIEKIYKVIE